ncbi:MAG: CHAP domain-containing protein [Clostridia bacterium]
MNNQYMPQKFKVSKKTTTTLSSAQVIQRKNLQKTFRTNESTKNADPNAQIQSQSNTYQNTDTQRTVSSADKSVSINSNTSDKALSSAQVIQRKNIQKAYRTEKYNENTKNADPNAQTQSQSNTYQNTDTQRTVSSADKSVSINSNTSDKVSSSTHVLQHKNIQNSYRSVRNNTISRSANNYISKSITTASNAQKINRKSVKFAYKNVRFANDLYNEIQSNDNEKKSNLSRNFDYNGSRIIYKSKRNRYKRKRKLSSAQIRQRKSIKKYRQFQTAKKITQEIYVKLATIIKAVASKIATAVQALVLNPYFWIVTAVIAVVLVIGMFLTSITGGLFLSGFNIVISTSYLSDTDDMVDVNDVYDTYENNLQTDINSIEETYPDYDEYVYNVDDIYHDPHALASYFTAIYEIYNLELVSDDIVNLFNMQYEYNLEITTEITVTTETETIIYFDDYGNKIFMDIETETEEENEVLTVTLVNNNLSNIVTSLISDDELEYYNLLISTSGNYPYLFGGVDDSGTSVDIADVVFITTNRTGDLNIANTALSQVGNVGGEPYWSWYGFSYRVEWCACFVSWVLDQSDYDGIKFASCTQGIAYFKSTDMWVGYNITNVVAGDLIFFDWDNDGKANHVGIVLGTDGEYVYTVEGNSGDECKIKKYSLNSNSIFGYGLMS